MRRFFYSLMAVLGAALGAISISSPVGAQDFRENTTLVLTSGQRLIVDDTVLQMQGDGNFVLYHIQSGSWVPVWHTNTAGNPGARVQLQGDGNLVVYSATWVPLWQAGTGGQGVSSYVLTADGNFNLFDADSNNTFSTNTSTTATSGGNPPGALTWGARFADDFAHTWRSSETTPADLNEWQWRFEGQAIEGAWEPTNLYIYEGSNVATVDVYWYVTALASPNPGTVRRGLADCPNPVNSQICDRWRIRIDDDSDDLSSHRQNDLVCHEFGHTVGFRHAGSTGDTASSCLTWGVNARSGWWERVSVNGRY